MDRRAHLPALLASAALAGAFLITAASGAIPAAAAQAAAAAGPAIVTRPSDLAGVAAPSAHDVWAVGFASNGAAPLTLIRHWNGTTWRRVASPNPGGAGTGASNELQGVAALKADNAWAVGSYTDGSDGTVPKMLILHWNGRSWKHMASHFPGCLKAGDGLYGVAAISPHDAWAVGRATSCVFGDEITVILHWNGTTWAEVTSPDPGVFGDNFLTGIAARSAHDVWAVGSYAAPGGGPLQSLIVHWDGHSWTQVPSADPYDEDIGLTSVAAISATNAWAVGLATTGALGSSQILAFHWNGHSWQQVPAPQGLGQGLVAVAATRAAAWAVGFRVTKSQELTLTERWNGTAWKRVASPSPGPGQLLDGLQAVTVLSASNAWAVGEFTGKTTLKALIEHWNGRSWKVQR